MRERLCVYFLLASTIYMYMLYVCVCATTGMTAGKHTVWIIQTYAVQRDSDTLNNGVTFLPFFPSLFLRFSLERSSSAISIALYGYINIWVKSFISRVQNISGKFMLATLLKCVDDLESTVLESTMRLDVFAPLKKALKTP